MIDFASSGATLPAWWQFKNVGTCRQTSLNMNFVANVNDAVCVDWAQGQSAGGIGAYNIGARGANTSRLISAVAVPPCVSRLESKRTPANVLVFMKFQA